MYEWECTRSMINIGVNMEPFKILICCFTTVVGDTIVLSTSTQYSILTMFNIPSFEIHGRGPLVVQIIATSSALTPPIGYVSMFSYACMIPLLLVTFFFIPVFFVLHWCRYVLLYCFQGVWLHVLR